MSNNDAKFALGFFGVLGAIWAAFAIAWVVNVYQFVNCDFESDYECEVIHAVGVVLPVASAVTVWFDTDE